jgi:two-component system NarL family sensor kinase
MPAKSYQEEVVMFAIIGIIVFLVVISLMVFILLFYQKKRFQHKQQMATKKKEYANQLLQSQLEIQEQIFTSISNEIHDNVGQVLSLAQVQLSIIDQKDFLDKALLAETKESVSKAMTDLRDIAKSLSSDRVQVSSLTEITGYELQRINNSGIMLTSQSIEGTEREMQEQKKLILFRIIQEVLQNILKHSKAKNIDVTFRYSDDQLMIAIADNGTGFDTALIEKKDGLGLRNVVNRAALIGGKTTIQSTINEGTYITIISPYD